MLSALTLFTAVLVPPLAPQGQGSSTAPVVINEFSYDDSSTDDREFVELYNRSGAAVNISGWTLAAEGPGSGTGVALVTIPAGTVLPAGGYWVMGSAIVPNVNQVVGVTTIWGDGPNSLTLKDAAAVPNVIDTVGYETRGGIWNPAVIEGPQGIWGNMTSVDGHEMAWSRLVDGYDDNSNGRDFWLLPATPGASNGLAMPPFLFENFDGLTVDTDVPNWRGSFREPQVMDPTVSSLTNPATFNPNVIPVSPQGGNAMIQWDPAGGGNYAIYPVPIGPGQSFEAWVYFDAVPEVAGEHETWSVGFGTGATFFNVPDPSGTLGTTFNANTGVNWTYQVTGTGATLYLVDNNDGGWPAGGAITPPTVITQIPIQVGVNDGWRRLRLEVIGLRLVIAQFDGGAPIVFAPFTECCNAGCFPCGNGVNCPTECADPSTLRSYDFLWIGYREFVTNNPGLRPFTMDDLVLLPSTANVAYLSTSAPTTGGTPVVAANSPAVVGNSAFAVTSFNLVGGFGFFLAALSPSTLNLQPLGGQAGAAVLNQGSFFVMPLVSGTSTLAFNIPNVAAYAGSSIYWQALDLDFALGIPIPVGNSRVLQTVLGM